MMRKPSAKTPSVDPVSLSSSHALEGQKPLRRPVWWAMFLVATYTMSLWFQTFKVFTKVPSVATALPWLGVMALLIAVLGLLAYDSYVQEKAKGTIQKPARLFEWLIARRFLLQAPSQLTGFQRQHQVKDAKP